MKSKEEIKEYVKSHKGDYVSLFKKNNKNYISFRSIFGRFTGLIEKTKDSISAVRRFNSRKVKIKVKLKGQRKKQTFVYNVYNKTQNKNLLLRMNKKLRKNPPYNKFKDDAVPYVKNKKKVDLLFDNPKFIAVEIIKYEGYS
jgi:hypothetical protein